MIRSLCFLCLFFLIAHAATAQDRKFRGPKRPKPRQFSAVIPPKPGLIIHSNLFSLHEPEAGPSLGFEYRMSLHFSVGLEGTALLYNLNKDKDNGRGFRIQPEVRYWFAGRRRSFRGFFSLQATYKERSYRDSAMIWVDIGSVSGLPNVQRRRVYFQEKKQVLAGAANIGFQVRFGKADHFMFEVYGGVGLKQKDFYGRPAEYIYENRSWAIPDTDLPGVYPHLAMGARIGYCF